MALSETIGVEMKPTFPPPTNVVFFSSLHTVDTGLHTFIEGAGWLHHIDEIEFVAFPFPRVGDGEVEPLGVPPGVDVRLADQIVLIPNREITRS